MLFPQQEECHQQRMKRGVGVVLIHMYMLMLVLVLMLKLMSMLVLVLMLMLMLMLKLTSDAVRGLLLAVFLRRIRQGLAVSPGQEYAVATTRDNAVTLVGLAGEDFGLPYSASFVFPFTPCIAEVVPVPLHVIQKSN